MKFANSFSSLWMTFWNLLKRPCPRPVMFHTWENSILKLIYMLYFILFSFILLITLDRLSPSCDDIRQKESLSTASFKWDVIDALRIKRIAWLFFCLCPLSGQLLSHSIRCRQTSNVFERNRQTSIYLLSAQNSWKFTINSFSELL